MIDEETFELAQKRIATKHRPTKVDEIDIFSGLLFCGDCGYKMYLQQGAGHWNANTPTLAASIETG